MKERRDKLIQARKKKRMSRPQLAESVGVSFEHIKRLEYGFSNPSIPVMYKICTALEESPEEIFPDLVLSI